MDYIKWDYNFKLRINISRCIGAGQRFTYLKIDKHLLFSLFYASRNIKPESSQKYLKKRHNIL